MTIHGNFYFPQIIAYFDPLMNIAAGSYKFGMGWVYSTCSHQGRQMTVKVSKQQTGKCLLVLSILRKITDISWPIHLFS